MNERMKERKKERKRKQIIIQEKNYINFYHKPKNYLFVHGALGYIFLYYTLFILLFA